MGGHRANRGKTGSYKVDQRLEIYHKCTRKLRGRYGNCYEESSSAKRMPARKHKQMNNLRSELRRATKHNYAYKYKIEKLETERQGDNEKNKRKRSCLRILQKVCWAREDVCQGELLSRLTNKRYFCDD
jgi:hypothetical protein